MKPFGWQLLKYFTLWFQINFIGYNEAHFNFSTRLERHFIQSAFSELRYPKNFELISKIFEKIQFFFENFKPENRGFTIKLELVKGRDIRTHDISCYRPKKNTFSCNHPLVP